ncbi:MAG TPA: hypothetical protein VHJ69_06365 [Gemmatimonadales bacterium]|jgi:ribosomal protein S15P/S13E|nr:hypothetical protein [Gemmatimonadales bacterium]
MPRRKQDKQRDIAMLGATHNWVLSPDRKRVTCAKGAGGQTVSELWEAEGLTEFHDADLARATKEINAIVEKIERNNKDLNHTLSLIEFQGRHLMVWANYGAVTPDDDDNTIIKALKLKTKIVRK